MYHIQRHKVYTRDQVWHHASYPICKANTWCFRDTTHLGVFQHNVLWHLKRSKSQDPTWHWSNSRSSKASKDSRNSITPQNVSEHWHSFHVRREWSWPCYLHPCLHHCRWMKQSWLNSEEYGTNDVKLGLIQPILKIT